MWSLARTGASWFVGSTTGYLVIGLVALTLLAGSYVKGRVDGASICDGRLATAAAEYNEVRDEAVAKAEAFRASVARHISEIDSRYTKEMADAQVSLDRLRADVAAGRRKLRLATERATAANVSTTAGSPGMDHAPPTELGPNAVAAYHDLRRDHALITRQLLACQGVLSAERK